MNSNIDQEAEEILAALSSHPTLSRFVDSRLFIPQIHHSTGTIRLVILGQDPTVKNKKSRSRVTTVLNLDKPGSNLYNYLSRICNRLSFDLENVYATNYLKNFFIDPPAQITEINVFKEFALYWLPLLKEELSQFPDIPVITLGQPLLSAIVIKDASPKVRDYWGYMPDWKSGAKGIFHYLESDRNVLGRVVFPFPHQPSIGKQFYIKRFNDYTDFMRRQLISRTYRAG